MTLKASAPPRPLASSGSKNRPNRPVQAVATTSTPRAAVAVGQPRRQRDGCGEEGHADQLQHEIAFARIAELAGGPAQGEHCHEVEQHEGRQRDHRAEEQRALVVLEEHYERHRDPRLGIDDLLELRCLGDLEADIEAEQHQQQAGDERHPPSPGQELCVSQGFRQHQKGCRRQHEAERRAELGEHRIPASPVRRRILGRQQDRPAPFAAQSQPLPEAADRQQQGRKDADRVVARQESRSGTVDRPMVMSAATSVALRPMRSP